jgi:hypothetical protein
VGGGLEGERGRDDERVKLRRGGEGYWHSGSDDPEVKVADAHGSPDRASDLRR